MQRIILINLFLIFTLGLSAQNKYTSANKKAIKFYQKAEELSRQRKADEALFFISKALDQDNRFVEALLLSADIYSDKGDDVKVIEAYEKSISINPIFFPNAQFNLANVYFKRGDYDKAAQAYQAFLNLEKISVRNRNISLQNLKSCEFAKEALKNPNPFIAKSISDSINTNADEYWPSLTADEQTLIFTRKLSTGRMDWNQKEIYQEDLWGSERVDTTWSEAKALSHIINSSNNEGAQSITADGRYMYFTANGRADGQGRCDIYYSKKNGDTWSEPINCGNNVNTGDWEAQPSISSDGRTLYFVSNRKSGKGKMDIWKSNLIETLKDGRQRWSKAENLSINTAENEMSPFIHASHDYLIFASDGLVGMGGYDLYQTDRDAKGNWSEPKNLSYPINTCKDEIGLVINAKGDKGYFASNRVTDKGLDIYEFDMPLNLQPTKVNYLKGHIFDHKTKKPLEASLVVLDIDSQDTLADSKSDCETGRYLVCLPEGKNYLFHAQADGYLFYSDHFQMKEKTDQQAQKKDIALKAIQVGEEVVLNNIFFEIDSWHIKSESETEIKRLCDFLILNKNISIELSGHTDNTGLEEKNKTLSENRAKAVYVKLIERGIAENRLTYKGYSSSKPIGDNKTKIGRATNRRTEFKVIRQ